MSSSLNSLYGQHIQVLQQRTRKILAQTGIDNILIYSGQLITSFLDDYRYPFKANPQFKAWCPIEQTPHCWLLVNGTDKPKLWFYLPNDYWHCVTPLPNDEWVKEFDLYPFHKDEQLIDIKRVLKGRTAFIGEQIVLADYFNIKQDDINPQSVIDFYHYHRVNKTEYEQACLREAQFIAAKGHLKVKQAMKENLSEYEFNTLYLTATKQRDSDIPYDNIIALNEHASTLHYTVFEHCPPKKLLSLLIDAGAQYRGYAADITRTYTTDENSLFSALIHELYLAQQSLILSMKSGENFIQCHERMQKKIAIILQESQIIQGMDSDAIIASGLLASFFPHGLGHLLGLQVHDVGGFLLNEQGDKQLPPEHTPSLRCTRQLTPGMVLTIEPGIYFIDALLEPWHTKVESKQINWQYIEMLKPFGGIRIEDNIIVHESSIENITKAYLPMI